MLYLEDYLEMIEHLPQELRDRFTEMRELDLSVQNNMDDLEKRVKVLFNEWKRNPNELPPTADLEFEGIKKEYYKTLEDQDEKVVLANQMYELVDRYLRRLDTELHKFKCELEADNKGITELLEKRSLELDTPITSTTSSQKENRYERYTSRPREKRRSDSCHGGGGVTYPEKRPHLSHSLSLGEAGQRLAAAGVGATNGNNNPVLLASQLQSGHTLHGLPSQSGQQSQLTNSLAPNLTANPPLYSHPTLTNTPSSNLSSSYHPPPLAASHHSLTTHNLNTTNNTNSTSSHHHHHHHTHTHHHHHQQQQQQASIATSSTASSASSSSSSSNTMLLSTNAVSGAGGSSGVGGGGGGGGGGSAVVTTSAGASYTLGAGPAIAAAASQAIAATQKMQQGRRTPSLKASYEAINSTGGGTTGGLVKVNDMAIGRELAGAAQTAIQAIQHDSNKKRNTKKYSSSAHGSSLRHQMTGGTGGASSSSSSNMGGGGVSIISASSTSHMDLVADVDTYIEIGGAADDKGGVNGEELGATDYIDTYDPNEPRYCLCNQVSYGDMVACDNEDCPSEWFHYPCVGITAPPKGKWYCPQCTSSMRRRGGRKN